MASAVLHIKDSYYFEVPKIWWPSERTDKAEFPDVWVRLDDDYQLWEARRLYEDLAKIVAPPPWETLRDDYLHWKHSDHANTGKPLDVMLEEAYAQHVADYKTWQQAEGNAGRSLVDYLNAEQPELAWFSREYVNPAVRREWKVVKSRAEGVEEYKALPREWQPGKIAAYNKHLSGKILIPQPFGRLKNLYECESGFCISKFLVVEVAVAIVMCAVFIAIGRKISAGGPPRGRLVNFFEVFLVYLRDYIARPVIGGGHEDHGHEDHGPAEHAHEPSGQDEHKPAPPLGEVDESERAKSHHVHNPYAEADRFVPLLWTVFMFVLGCNLCGMVPWVGSPTGTFGVTTGLAFATLGTGLVFGVLRFGPVGFFTNMVPGMDLPLAIAIIIKPMLLLIEMVGWLIKHAVLAIRLLANMVAGHLVLLGIMGLAFGAAAATSFSDAPDWRWWMTAAISVVASALFSCLELFVAFLQAYIFTFLSALFISSSIHHH